MRINTTLNIRQTTVTEKCPTKQGLWYVECDESDGEWTPIAIFEKNGVLCVDCPDIGTYPLEQYHNNLCNIRWAQ